MMGNEWISANDVFLSRLHFLIGLYDGDECIRIIIISESETTLNI